MNLADQLSIDACRFPALMEENLSIGHLVNRSQAHLLNSTPAGGHLHCRERGPCANATALWLDPGFPERAGLIQQPALASGWPLRGSDWFTLFLQILGGDIGVSCCAGVFNTTVFVGFVHQTNTRVPTT